MAWQNYFWRQYLRIGFLVYLAGTLFSCQQADIAEIHLQGPPLSELTNRERVAVQMHYKAGEDDFSMAATINRRGGMSFSFDKYSYTLHLDRKVPLGFLPMDNDWVLNASYIDKTFMRHKIAYDLFRQMGKNNLSPQVCYFRLSYNNAYQGLYILMEKMDASTLYLDKKQQQACIFKDPPLFTPNSLSIIPDSNNFFEQKYPALHKADKNRELLRLKKFLFYSSGEAFDQQVSFYFDLDNIIDWHLLLLFSNNSDGILKNFYLYKQNDQTPYRIAVWDYDHSFGRDGDNELNLIRPLRPSRSILLHRLLENNTNDYRCRLSARWQELQQADILTAHNIQQMIQSNLSLMESELKRNAQKWPLHGKWYYDSNDYTKEIKIIETYLSLRIPQLEAYFEEMAKNCEEL